jgi:hypothetical protein
MADNEILEAAVVPGEVVEVTEVDVPIEAVVTFEE